MADDSAAAYLLMSAERHLPSRKRHEDDAVACEELRQQRQETPFVADVLDYVVADDDVKRALQFFQQENIRCYEITPRVTARKEFPCIGYPPLVDVNAQRVASHLGEREQIATVSATNLQYAAVLIEPFELPDVWYKVFPAGLCQFVEIECPVRVTFLHVLYTNGIGILQKHARCQYALININLRSCIYRKWR